MPLYNVTTQTGVLNGEAKARLADKLTTFHSDYSGVPPAWVQIVFHDYAPGSGFSGREARGNSRSDAFNSNRALARI